MTREYNEKLRIAHKTDWGHLLDTTGDGLGDTDVIGDYSAGVPFYYECKAGERIDISRMIMAARGSGVWASNKYGSLASLGNGFLVQVLNEAGGVRRDLLNGLTVKTFGDWKRVCYDAEPLDFGAGDKYFGFRWTFNKDHNGKPLVITAGEIFRIVAQDDLSGGLNEQRFTIRGETFPQ